MCRYVRGDPCVGASFWRDVLYCDGERPSARMAGNRASFSRPLGTATNELASRNAVALPVTGDTA